MCSGLPKVCEDEALDRGMGKEEIAKCIRKVKNKKTGGSDGLVGELLKYGRTYMVYSLEEFFRGLWHEEVVPKEWRERKGIRAR